MNIQQAIEQIIKTVSAYTEKRDGMAAIPIESQRPIYLYGPPGVGKTAILYQAAQRLGVGIVSYTMTHHTRQSAIGLPELSKRTFAGKEYTVTEYTMSEIIAGVYQHMERTGQDRGILFLDEINCVSETLLPAMLELLQRKRFGEYRVPDGWVIVCAGNPERYNRSAREFDLVTMDRLRLISIDPDAEAWQDYAAARDVDVRVRSYLRLRPDDLCRAEDMRIVTPRSWTDLSDMMRASGECDELLIRQYLQVSDIADDFIIYAAMCDRVGGKFLLDRALNDADVRGDVRFDDVQQALFAAMLLADAMCSRARVQTERINARRAALYFAEGVAQDGKPNLRKCAEEHLERRINALNVRLSMGALDRTGEARERAAIAAIRDLMKRDPEEMVRAAREGLNDAQAADEQCALQLTNALSFADHAFSNLHVKCVFLAELERCPDAVSILRRSAGDMYAKMKRETDPDARMRDLKAKIRTDE